MKENLKTPIHLWIVGILAVLWNSGGVFDFVMTNKRDEGYMEQLTSEHVVFLDAMPSWAIASWAVAVFAAFLASILLLMRKRIAVEIFTLGLIAMTISFFRNFVLADGGKIMGAGAALYMTIAIALIQILLVFYAVKMKAKGVLC